MINKTISLLEKMRTEALNQINAMPETQSLSEYNKNLIANKFVESKVGRMFLNDKIHA